MLDLSRRRRKVTVPPLQLSSVSTETLNVYLHVWDPWSQKCDCATATQGVGSSTSAVLRSSRHQSKELSSAVGSRTQVQLKCQPAELIHQSFYCMYSWGPWCHWNTDAWGRRCVIAVTPVISLRAPRLVLWILCNRKINDQCARRRFKCSSFSLQCILLMCDELHDALDWYKSCQYSFTNGRIVL